jgi:thiol-disulfide isomerase/thioredoxin
MVIGQEQSAYIIYQTQVIDTEVKEQNVPVPNKRIVYRKDNAIYQRDFFQGVPAINFSKIDGENLIEFTAQQDEKIALTSKISYPDYTATKREERQKQIAGIWADRITLESVKGTVYLYVSAAYEGFYCPVFGSSQLVLGYQQWFEEIGWVQFEAIEVGQQLTEVLPAINESAYKKVDKANYQAEQKSMLTQLQEKIDRNVASMLGKKAKKFLLTTLEGERINSSQLKGKVIVLNFWFINCGPCRREMPELNQLVQQFEGNEAVVFLGLALDPPHELPDFLEKNTFLYNIAGDAIYLSDKFKVTNYPTNIIIDKNGKITTYLVGFTPGIGHKLKTEIDRALSD